MKQPRYAQLKEAAHHRERLFKKYEEDCRQFIKRFRMELAKYLECSDDRITWLQFAETEEEQPLFKGRNKVEVVLGRRMILYDDASYAFAFKIDFDSNWVSLVFTIKRTDKHFVVEHEKRLEIPRDRPEELEQLLEYTFNVVKEYLETDFENFLHGKRPTIGFIKS